MGISVKWIAFLRAINVGGHTVKMDNLRSLFEAMGFSNVETFIASGNVIFDASGAQARELEQLIERSLRQSLGYEVATFLRSGDELAAISSYQPFGQAGSGDEENGLYIAFTASPPGKAAIDRLMTYRSPNDDFHVNNCEIYWQSKKKISESVFSGALLEKAIGMPATMRNMNTVRKLAAKYGKE